MKNGELKIEKGVPIPPRSYGRYAVMKQMKVGDSVFISDSSGAQNAAQEHLGAGNYKTKKEGDGRRVWRMK